MDNREYIYSLPNASCTLAIIDNLRRKYQSYLDSVAVINLIDRWLLTAHRRKRNGDSRD